MLERALHGKWVHDRPIVVTRPSRVDATNAGQVVFIGASVGAGTGGVLALLRDRPVLTVGDTARFPDLGGIINFIIEDHKVRFEINVDAAERAGLKVSSRLLTVAKIVHEPSRAGGG